MRNEHDLKSSPLPQLSDLYSAEQKSVTIHGCNNLEDTRCRTSKSLNNTLAIVKIETEEHNMKSELLAQEDKLSYVKEEPVAYNESNKLEGSYTLKSQNSATTETNSKIEDNFIKCELVTQVNDLCYTKKKPDAFYQSNNLKGRCYTSKYDNNTLIDTKMEIEELNIKPELTVDGLSYDEDALHESYKLEGRCHSSNCENNTLPETNIENEEQNLVNERYFTFIFDLRCMIKYMLCGGKNLQTF